MMVPVRRVWVGVANSLRLRKSGECSPADYASTILLFINDNDDVIITLQVVCIVPSHSQNLSPFFIFFFLCGLGGRNSVNYLRSYLVLLICIYIHTYIYTYIYTHQKMHAQSHFTPLIRAYKLTICNLSRCRYLSSLFTLNLQLFLNLSTIYEALLCVYCLLGM